MDPAAVFLGWSGVTGTLECVGQMVLRGASPCTLTLQMGKLRCRGSVLCSESQSIVRRPRVAGSLAEMVEGRSSRAPVQDLLNPDLCG